MPIPEEKFNQLRAKYVEDELRRPTKDQAISDDAMLSEIDAHADELAHTDKPGTPTKSRKSYKFRLFAVFVAIIFIIAGIVYFAMNSLGSDAPICRTRCCDGTCSSSIGSGTCSHHGGICPIP